MDTKFIAFEKELRQRWIRLASAERRVSSLRQAQGVMGGRSYANCR